MAQAETPLRNIQNIPTQPQGRGGVKVSIMIRCVVKYAKVMVKIDSM
jgi:hypothetical protein